MHFIRTRDLKTYGLLITSLVIFSPLVGCSSSSSTTATTTTNAETTDASFPSSLSVSSPTDVVVEDENPTLASKAQEKPTMFAKISDWFFPQAIASSDKVPRHMWATLKIDALLAGTATPMSIFKPALFLTTDVNANCFGPSVNYTNHPDGSIPNSGQLPGGDLGIWLETDATSGHACSAAQLNSRMRGISWRSNMALMGLASVIGKLNSAGTALPTAGNSVGATTLMTTLTIPSTTFTLVTLSLDTAGTTWTYVMNFTYVDSTSVSHDIELGLTHTSGASSAIYSGLLTYGIGETVSFGNCPGTGARAITYIGTLKYTRAGLTDMEVIHRSGNYCGSGSTTTQASFESDGQLDPAGKYNSSSATGWGDNFSRFGASYNPVSLEGDYLYGWQAGMGDSNMRIFAMGLEAPATGATRSTSGEAYFGYGDEVVTTNGDIKGLFCNWAGPGAPHTMQDYVQRQAVTYDTTNTLWKQSTTKGADILYAPTNDCTYDGTGTFAYDRDLDGATTDEVASDLIVAAVGSGPTPELDLMDKGSSVDIPAEIASLGTYTNPGF